VTAGALSPGTVESWRDLRPPPLPALPVMSSAAERRFYYWLTRERFQERGAVVELGCWLGGGTQYLAAGLRDRGSQRRLVAVDRFVWVGEFYEGKFASGLPEGADFEPLFRRNLGPLIDWVEPVRSTLDAYRWPGGPIEVMLVDAPKLLPDVVRFLATFGPAFVPGVTLLAFQDYLHNASYALPAVLGELGDALRLVDVVLPGTTAVFEIRQPLLLDRERLARCRIDRWSAEATIERWGRIVAALPQPARAAIALSLPMMLHDLGFIAAAKAEAAKLTDVPIARHRLQKWANGALYWTYAGIYDVFGIRPDRASAPMLLKLSKAEARAGRPAAALDACRRAIELDPTHAEARRRLRKLEREGRWRSAARALRSRLAGRANRLRRHAERIRAPS
jgi:hypothetical protein